MCLETKTENHVNHRDEKYNLLFILTVDVAARMRKFYFIILLLNVYIVLTYFSLLLCLLCFFNSIFKSSFLFVLQ